jgi:hypothetical protein
MLPDRFRPNNAAIAGESLLLRATGRLIEHRTGWSCVLSFFDRCRVPSLSGTALLAAALLLVLPALPARKASAQGGAGAGGSIPLRVKCVGAAQSNAAVFTGIPFPPGVCRDVTQVSLLSNGRAVPRQAEVLSRYADGSLRVVLLGFVVSLPSGASLDAQVRYEQGPGLDLSPRLPWSRNVDALAMCPPRWYGESGVFNLRFLASADNTAFPQFDSRMRAQFVTQCDPPSTEDPEYRGYYDHTHALYMSLLREGLSSAEPRIPAAAPRQVAIELSKYREQEILHSGAFAGQYRGGRRSQNTTPLLLDTIRRIYPQGLLEDHYFTGDPRSLQVAREMGEQLVRDAYQDVERFLCQERMPGFETLGLCALYEATGERRFLDAARYIASVIIEHQDAMADKFPNQGGVAGQTGGFIQNIYGKWFDPSESSAAGAGSPWMTTLAVEGLIRLYWLTGDPGVRKSIVAAADWMVDAGFAAKGAPGNNSGADGFWYLCKDSADTTVFPALNPMHLQTLGFAHQVTGNGKYRSLAERIIAPSISWGRTLKEYNQALHSCAQGLYLLQYPEHSVPLTLAESGMQADDVAPAAPVGMTAALGSGQVVLTWSPVDARDLAGYRVWRALGSGDFSVLGEVPSGTTAFLDGAPGAAPVSYQVAAVDRTGNLSVAAGTVTTVPSAAGSFAISGKVTDAGYGAVSGVVIQAGGRRAITGPDGGYRIPGLPPGSYTVTAGKPGFTFTAPTSVSLADAGATAGFTTANSWIFRETLPAGWKASGSKAKYSLTTSTVAAEEYRTISVTLSKGGSLELSGPGISLQGKRVLKFFVHGGSASNQQIRLQALVTPGPGAIAAAGVAADGVTLMRKKKRPQPPEEPSVTVSLADPKYGGPIQPTWREYTVPLADLGATGGTLTGVQLSASTAQKLIYIDTIQVQ